MSDKIQNGTNFIDNPFVRTTGSVVLSAGAAKGSVWGLKKIKNKIK